MTATRGSQRACLQEHQHQGGPADGSAGRTRPAGLLPCIGRKVTFRDTLTENKPLTPASLHEMSRKDAYSGDANRKRSRHDGKIPQTYHCLQSRTQGELFMMVKRELREVTTFSPFISKSCVPPAFEEQTAVCVHGQRPVCFKSSHMDSASGELGDNTTLDVDGHKCLLDKCGTRQR